MVEQPEYPTRNLQQTVRNTYEQFFIVLPPSIVRGLGWKKGDEIEIILEDGDIRLHKKRGKRK